MKKLDLHKTLKLTIVILLSVLVGAVMMGYLTTKDYVQNMNRQIDRYDQLRENYDKVVEDRDSWKNKYEIIDKEYNQ